MLPNRHSTDYTASNLVFNYCELIPLTQTLTFNCQHCIGSLLNSVYILKYCCIPTYKALNGSAPQYLNKLLTQYSPSCLLQSRFWPVDNT